MINLLVISGSKPEAFQFLLIARELLSYNILMHIATTRRHVYDFIKKEGWEQVISMELEKPDMSVEINSEEYLNKYVDPTIAQMIGSEQAIKNWNIDQKLFLLVEFLNKYEDYFEKKGIDVLIKFPTCSFAGRAAYAVARRRKLPTLIINTGPVISDTFTLNDIDEGWLWSEFFESYRDGKPVTDNQKKMVGEMVNKVVLDKKKSISINKPKIARTFFHGLKYIYHRTKGECDYIEKNEVKKEFSFLWGSFYSPVNYCNVDTSKPYIFFPLHIPWDAQIATRNPMFYSQDAIVEMLARACPPGINVYIKEHPYFAGGFNRKMLKDLKRFEAVKVLHPTITSLEVIKNAKAVITINSTAGLEAILLKKPLVVLGNPYYAYFKYAYNVKDINELPRILNEAICKGESIYDDEEEWYKFMFCAVSTAKKGSMVFYKNYMGLGENLDKERINLLSNEIKHKIEKIIKKKRKKAESIRMSRAK